MGRRPVPVGPPATQRDRPEGGARGPRGDHRAGRDDPRPRVDRGRLRDPLGRVLAGPLVARPRLRNRAECGAPPFDELGEERPDRGAHERRELDPDGRRDPGPRERRARRGHRVRRGRSARPPRGFRERGRADGRRVARGPSVGSLDRRRRRDREWGERRPGDRDQRTGPGRIGRPAPRDDPGGCGGPVDVRDRRIRGATERVAHPVGRPQAARVPRVRQRRGRDHRERPAGHEGQGVHREPRGPAAADDRIDGLRAHPMGDPRAAVEGERPSARRLHRQDRAGPQRDHRNYASLREKLEARGHTFVSQTDTESLVHLIESHYEGNLEDATRKALHEARGSYAILAIHADEPGKVVGARNESPLVVGVGPDENFLASDVPALLRYTDRVLYVMDKEMVVITPKGVSLTDLEGKAVARDPQRITWSLEDAEKGGFDHFMLKEIHEAPKAIHETLLGRLANLEVDGFTSQGVTSVKLVACGTSYHAALVGKYVFEEIARIPASAELASEYRYSQGPSERPLVILISQSGETADTVGAAREARRRGSKTLCISNVVGSSLTRETDKTIYTRAGIEIGVAATKTFIAQLVALYLIALKLGQDRGTLGYDELDRLKDQLRSLPRAAQYVLDRADEIRNLAKKYGNARDLFYIGRHANYPVALEGALKLKEISYIHAEAYAAGELKHGPLALVTPATPVIAVVVQDPTYEKMRSNIGEVSARGSPVLAIGTEGDKELPKFVDDVFEVPNLPWVLSPVPVSVALQLFAYEVAKMHDCPIDKPRNLAKSVTVE